MLIISEAMAMYMHPVLEPYLPSHAWCLMKDPMYVPGLKAVESIGRNVEYDTGRHSFMFWDLGVDGHITIESHHIKIINNMVQPYVSHWWVDTLCQLYNLNEKNGKWIVTDDEYSALPSLIVDIILLRLDHSEVLKKHPLWVKIQQLISSDKKGKVGVVRPVRFPKSIEGYAHLDYHRLGPVILVSFKGPAELQELVQHAVALELKSTLRFDRKLVNHSAFSVKNPKRPKTKLDAQEMAEYEAKFAELKEIYDITAAGTKKTRNRARTRLQELAGLR